MEKLVRQLTKYVKRILALLEGGKTVTSIYNARKDFGYIVTTAVLSFYGLIRPDKYVLTQLYYCFVWEEMMNN